MNFEVIPFLSLNGRAAEAIAFYEEALQAKTLLKVTYEQMKSMDPDFAIPPGREQWITHSVLQIGANKLMVAEEPADAPEPWRDGNAFSLCIQSRSAADIEALYAAVTRHPESSVVTPLAPNSFSAGFAIVRDPFGVILQFVVTRHDF